MSVLHRLGLVGAARSNAEVADEARAEIAFHLESRVRELIEAGADEESARRTAAASFGDVETVVRQCVWARNGEVMIMQRILFGLVVVLAVGFGVMVWQNLSLHAEARATEQELAEARIQLAQQRAERPPATVSTAGSDRAAPDSAALERTIAPTSTGEAEFDAASFRARFADRPLDAGHALTLARLLAKLPADSGWRLLAELWPGLSSVARRAALRAFADVGHEHLLDVLDLGANDPQVRDAAFELLRSIALRDFHDEPAAYAAWRASTRGLPCAEVIARGAGPLVMRLQAMSANEGLALLDALGLDSAMRSDAGLAQALRDAGALQLVEAWLCDGATSRAFAIAGALGADDAWLQAHVARYATDPSCDADRRAAACVAISRPGAGWAVPVVETFARGYLAGLAPGSVEVGTADGPLLSAMRGLVEIGDPRAIPLMIAMIRDDASGAAIYNVGHFGLARLTGVSFDDAHDGAWWVQWWHDNQPYLPAAIRGMALPE